MKTWLMLVALQLGASGTDAFYTHQANPRYEQNPIAKPFMGSTAGQVAFFGGGAALRIGLSYALHKKHPKIADGILIEGTGENTFSAVYTAHYAK